MQQHMSESARRNVSVWLALCLGIVALIVVVGGLTRLTESGLSIVEWKPITGILPPMNDDEFTKEFATYQAFPQFKKSFPGMTLAEFRHIYWLEYIHRLLGRLAGMMFLLPLLGFALTRTLPWRNALKLTGIFLLGGAQGGIGWYMVQSGLIDDPHVSAYRLVLHLGTGFLLFALILWQWLTFTHPGRSSGGFELPPPPLPLKGMACLVVMLLFLQVMMGGAVAGLHAGLMYNTFPRMEGQWVPDGVWPLGIWYRNLFEDVTTAQFVHRMIAYSLSVVILLFWMMGRNNPHIVHLLPIVFSIFVVQFLLGILTLLFMVPVPLAALHQANALLLFAIATGILHRLCIPLHSIAYETGGRSLPA